MPTSREEQIINLSAKIPFTDGDKNGILKLLSDRTDWRILTNLASRYDILPTILQNILSVKSNLVPAAALQEVLRRARRSYLANNLILWDELKRILSAAGKGRVKVIPIKGVVMTAVLYDDVALRRTTDIDFLVKRSDIPAINDALAELGYRRMDDNPFMNMRFHSHYEKKGVNDIAVAAEAHWDMLSPWRRIDGLIADFWRNASVQKISGEDILTLSTEDILFVSIVELFKDIMSRYRHFLLKRSLDIARILYRFGGKIGWDDFVRRADDYGLKDLAYYALSSNKESFGDERTARDVLAKLKPSPVRRALISTIPPKTALLKQTPRPVRRLSGLFFCDIALVFRPLAPFFDLADFLCGKVRLISGRWK